MSEVKSSSGTNVVDLGDLAGVGHNSAPAAPGAERLRNIVERIERLNQERKELAGDVRDIYAEAKSAGYDVKVLRALIRLRTQDPDEVEEQEAQLSTYRHALGM